MSLAAPYIESYLVADGVTTVFAYGQDFDPLAAGYVKCIIYFSDNTSCIPNFTVDIGTHSIRIVSLTTPDGQVLTIPPAGSIVRIFRDVPEAQEVTASQLKAYTAKQIEHSFDQIVAMIQEVSFTTDHKTVRLTETQRDVSLDKLGQAQDGALIYWTFADGKLKATNFRQDQVLLSDTIKDIEYDNASQKLSLSLRDGGSAKPIGAGIVHNDLQGRNANDCHPQSAITGLAEDLQDLKDADIRIEQKADDAVATADRAEQKADDAEQKADEAIRSISVDGITINRNDSNEMQTIAVIDDNLGDATKTWSGTLEEYFAIQDKDPDTLYYITNDREETEVYTKEEIDEFLDAKQDLLIEGDNITIDDDNVISAENTTYTAGNGLTLTGTEFSANVINNTSSTSRTDALSAAMGKDLQDQILNLKARGRYLSIWDCTTGLATTTPTTDPYEYRAGDYFIVGIVGATNYRPTGSEYSESTPSTEVETGDVKVNDTYYYDGTTWTLLDIGQVASTFASLAGSPYDNDNLSTALNAKQEKLTAGANISIVNNVISATGDVSVDFEDLTGDPYDNENLATALDDKQGKLTAGTNITIDPITNVISATGGSGSSEWGAITGDIEDQTDLQAALDLKANSADLATVATSGSYNDLEDKPTIPAAQVNSDWNAISGVAQILNKPTLATVATSGSYNDLTNKPTIPTKTSDLTNDSDYQTGTQVSTAISTHNSSTSAHSDIRTAVAGKSTVSVSATGTATAEVQYITIDGVEKKLAGGSGGGSEEDNLSITKNASDKIQTVGVIDQNDTTRAVKEWFGTRDEYDAIETKDDDTEYTITDDSDLSMPILQALYPVGSVYITFNETCPLANLFGTWQKVGAGRVLQGADGTHLAGSTIEAGLPNITGKIPGILNHGQFGGTGAFISSELAGSSTSGYVSNGGNYVSKIQTTHFNASRSNSIYGNSTTVQPEAICINIFKRTA